MGENENQQDPVTHPCQAGSRRDFIGDVLPVDVPNARAWNVKHATAAHPHLGRGQNTNHRMIPGNKWGKKRHFMQ